MNFKWLPNALTIARCLFAGFVLVGFWQAMSLDLTLTGLSPEELSRRATLQQLWYQFAFFAFLAGALTDFLDGWLARRLDAHSRFGVWLDPIADKLLIAAALLGLALEFRTWLIYIPAAMIIARDVFMTWFRATPRGRSVVVPSSLAKWKTGFEMAAIIGLILPLAVLRMDAGEPLTDGSPVLAIVATVAVVGLLWVAAALSWLTAGQYMKAAGTESR
ncbi:CDP-alcohol phosphatidyltransferase family protein [Hyphomonas sp.]|uniref:CDP-alcohol phosphatidyltransferase family protein n=1 Tax=Hyphomonas sp. TaxID=87 RepID=UPI0025B8EAE4|nr:CDP-alcohol phosphatidyltransferase family protein [Hyphomonas sp.]